jgi:hypothetical protein
MTHDVSIVAAFFDIGRGGWGGEMSADPRRSFEVVA